jgi:hypothetical protein
MGRHGAIGFRGLLRRKFQQGTRWVRGLRLLRLVRACESALTQSGFTGRSEGGGG